MAQGCHLIFSSEDREHFRLSTPPRDEALVREAALRDLGLKNSRTHKLLSVRDGHLAVDHAPAVAAGVDPQVERFVERVAGLPRAGQEIIAEVLRSHPRKSIDVVAGLGNTALSDQMARALPSALGRVLRHSPGAPGLFAPARAGASSWVSNLKNSGAGKADGTAYEVLATAALIERVASGRNGRSLHIGATDSLAFGPKVQGWYGRPGSIAVSDGSKRSVFYQPTRKTAEADLLIRRGGEEIAVDFKHTQGPGPVRIEVSEIEAAWTALRTGEVTQFHFVSNAAFDANTVKKVGEINELIESHNREEGREDLVPIELFEYFEWK